MLVKGLPPDAALHRAEAFPPELEMAVRQVEWLEALAGLQAGKRVPFPAHGSVVRPRDELPVVREPETDPKVIAAWFGRLGNA